MYLLVKKLLVLWLLVNSLFLPLAVQAQSSTPEPGGTDLDLLGIVRQARGVLQAEVDHEQADRSRKPVVVTSRHTGLKAKLALWNEQTNEISYVTVVNGTGQVTSVDKGSPYDVKLRRDNGVNSEFTIVNHPELHVAALKMPIFVDIGTTRRPRFRLDNVVYTPYGSWLNTPPVVAAGEEYLKRNVTAVYDELRALGVTSRAFPDKSLADSIEPALVQSIVAIEHVSAASLLFGKVEDYLNVFLTTVAANEHVAYAYARSTASASGLVQFIPSTYALVVKKRADLALNKSFSQGMTDPYNAIKAQVALLDINLTTLSGQVRQQYAGNGRELGAILAAMYNGGTTRVLRALKQWGSDWAHDHTADLAGYQAAAKTAKADISRLKKLLAGKKLTAAARTQYTHELAAARTKQSSADASYAAGKKAVLKRETVLYVAKFYLLYDYLATHPTTLASNTSAAATAPAVP